jgi:hypothetical protein
MKSRLPPRITQSQQTKLHSIKLVSQSRLTPCTNARTHVLATQQAKRTVNLAEGKKSKTQVYYNISNKTAQISTGNSENAHLSNDFYRQYLH